MPDEDDAAVPALSRATHAQPPHLVGHGCPCVLEARVTVTVAVPEVVTRPYQADRQRPGPVEAARV